MEELEKDIDKQINADIEKYDELMKKVEDFRKIEKPEVDEDKEVEKIETIMDLEKEAYFLS